MKSLVFGAYLLLAAAMVVAPSLEAANFVVDDVGDPLPAAPPGR